MISGWNSYIFDFQFIALILLPYSSMTEPNKTQSSNKGKAKIHLQFSGHEQKQIKRTSSWENSIERFSKKKTLLWYSIIFALQIDALIFQSNEFTPKSNNLITINLDSTSRIPNNKKNSNSTIKNTRSQTIIYLQTKTKKKNSSHNANSNHISKDQD